MVYQAVGGEVEDGARAEYVVNVDLVIELKFIWLGNLFHTLITLLQKKFERTPEVDFLYNL